MNMKYFYRLLTTVVLTLIILAIALYLNRAWFLSKIFSSKLKTKVSIEKIYITSNSIRLHGIKIYNKFGDKKKMPYALTIQTIHIDAPLKNYVQRHVEINSILVYDVNLYIQFLTKDHSKTNWSELMHSFNPETETLAEKKSETYSTIKHLEIKKIKAHIGNIFNVDVMLKGVSNIHFHNINTQKGRIFQKIAQTIVSNLVFHIQDIIALPLKIPFEIIKSLLRPKTQDSKTQESNTQESKAEEPKPQEAEK